MRFGFVPLLAMSILSFVACGDDNANDAIAEIDLLYDDGRRKTYDYKYIGNLLVEIDIIDRWDAYVDGEARRLFEFGYSDGEVAQVRESSHDWSATTSFYYEAGQLRNIEWEDTDDELWTAEIDQRDGRVAQASWDNERPHDFSIDIDFTYDSDERLTTVTEQRSSQEPSQVDYQFFDDVLQRIRRDSGSVARFEYGGGDVLTEIENDGRVTRLRYDRQGRVEEIIGRGYTAKIAYARHQIDRIRLPLGGYAVSLPGDLLFNSRGQSQTSFNARKFGISEVFTF